MDRSLIQSRPAQWAAPEQRLPVTRGPHWAEIARPWQPVTARAVLLRPSVTSSAQEAPAGVNKGGLEANCSPDQWTARAETRVAYLGSC